MRGAVAAGMCLVLEAAGLMQSFDRVYGCSSGALTGCFAAAGQASRVGDELRGLRGRDFIDPARAFRGGPAARPRLPVRRGHRPAAPALRRRAGARAPSCARSRCRPRTRSCGCWVTSRAPRTSSPPCGRAARSRWLTGAPPMYRGEPMVDGGLLEAIPYRTALREGATHVLVLRTQEASYRGRRQDRFAERVLARAHPELAPLLHTCSQRYNRDAAALQQPSGQPARAAGRRAARQPPGVALQHRPRPHRRQRAAGRAHDGVLALRRARHRVLAALPRAARWAPSQAACCLAGGGLGLLDRVAEAAPLGHAAVDHVDHLARAARAARGSPRPPRAGPTRRSTAIGRCGSSPSGSPSMSCQGVNAEPGMWPASYSRALADVEDLDDARRARAAPRAASARRARSGASPAASSSCRRAGSRRAAAARPTARAARPAGRPRRRGRRTRSPARGRPSHASLEPKPALSIGIADRAGDVGVVELLVGADVDQQRAGRALLLDLARRQRQHLDADGQQRRRG